MSRRITVKRGPCFYTNITTDASICIEGLRKYVELPRRIKQIELVYTKRNTNANCFELLPFGYIHDVTESLTSPFMALNSRMYRQGYRYFCVEYESK